MVKKMANHSALWVVVIVATVLATQPANALLGLGGGGLGGLLGGGGGGGGGLPSIPGLNNCDPTKLEPCALSLLQLKLFPPSQICCSSLSSLLSCFCNLDSSLQQLLSGTAGHFLSIACSTSVPTCS